MWPASDAYRVAFDSRAARVRHNAGLAVVADSSANSQESRAIGLGFKLRQALSRTLGLRCNVMVW